MIRTRLQIMSFHLEHRLNYKYLIEIVEKEERLLLEIAMMESLNKQLQLKMS